MLRKIKSFNSGGIIKQRGLGGNKMEEWFFKKSSIKIIDMKKEEIIKLFKEHKDSLKWTLYLESLYPR